MTNLDIIVALLIGGFIGFFSGIFWGVALVCMCRSNAITEKQINKAEDMEKTSNESMVKGNK